MPCDCNMYFNVVLPLYFNIVSALVLVTIVHIVLRERVCVTAKLLSPNSRTSINSSSDSLSLIFHQHKSSDSRHVGRNGRAVRGASNSSAVFRAADNTVNIGASIATAISTPVRRAAAAGVAGRGAAGVASASAAAERGTYCQIVRTPQ